MTTPVTALPGRWGSAPYLLMGHGRASVLARWTGRSVDEAILLALTGRRPGDVGLVGLGPAAQVAELLGRAVPELHDAGVDGDGDVDGGGRAPVWTRLRWATVPRGTWTALQARAGHAGALLAGWSAPASWDCMWTRRPLVNVPHHDVERLPADDPAVQAEVAATLERAHPTASTAPDDPRLMGWWGVRAGGRLVAVVGLMRYGPGLAPHLVSLGVDPEHRGRGLAGAVLSAAVRDGLAAGTDLGEPAVWLGLYAANSAARRVYLRHGFELGGEFDSRDAPVAVDLTTSEAAASGR